MCRRCNEDGRFDACAACRQAQSREVTPPAAVAPGNFPFRRDGIEWGRFLRYCFGIYTKNFGLLTLSVMVPAAAAVVGSIISVAFAGEAGEPLWLAAQFLQFLLFLALLVGALEISLRVAQGQAAHVGMIFSGFRNLGRFFVVMLGYCAPIVATELAMMLAVGLGGELIGDVAQLTLGAVLLAGLTFLAGCALLIYMGLSFVFAGIEVVARPQAGVIQALKNAWRIAHGERLTVGFGLFLINLLVLAGVIMCGVGAIFTVGYALVLFASLYLALRNGAPLDQA